MLWLLCMCLAWAEPEPLLGPEPPPVPEQTVQPSLDQLLAAAQTPDVIPAQPVAPRAENTSLPELSGMLPWGLALLGAGATFLWMRRRGGASMKLGRGLRPTEGPLNIVARKPLGPQSALLLVEAQAGDGRTRRLLLSTNPSSSPTLVADLGVEAIPDVAVAAPPPLPSAAAQPARRKPARPFQLPAEPELTPVQGRSLVDELLAERRGYSPRRSA